MQKQVEVSRSVNNYVYIHYGNIVLFMSVDIHVPLLPSDKTVSVGAHN